MEFHDFWLGWRWRWNCSYKFDLVSFNQCSISATLASWPCFLIGESAKSRKKSAHLQKQVSLLYLKSANPGPATYLVQCLYILPVFQKGSESLSHLILSTFRLFVSQTTANDIISAKLLATQLILDSVTHSIHHSHMIIVTVIQMFGVELSDIEAVLSHLKARGDNRFDATPAKQFVEDFIFELIELKLFEIAVALLDHFSIRNSGVAFISRLMQRNHDNIADKWSEIIGRAGIRVLVRECAGKKLFKRAYNIIMEHNLQNEFRGVCYQYKESLLKKLSVKALWDFAESKTRGDQQLIGYLVFLAMEAGDTEKVDELSDKYCLQGFEKDRNLSQLQHRYLRLNDLNFERIQWVDTVDALCNATSYIQRCDVVGVDCEWKPNYFKGMTQNKVSIIQIASKNMAFIIDLLKLCREAPYVVDNCFCNIFQSPTILKLGYDFHSDLQQLSQSYALDCFKQYRMVLDLKKLNKESRGGLSGFSEKILGAGLDKKRRVSDWEQRPLSQSQIEYAAMDAVVLVHIFLRIKSMSQNGGGSSSNVQLEVETDWKSCIVSYWNKSPEKSKKRNQPKSNLSK